MTKIPTSKQEDFKLRGHFSKSLPLQIIPTEREIFRELYWKGIKLFTEFTRLKVNKQIFLGLLKKGDLGGKKVSLGVCWLNSVEASSSSLAGLMWCSGISQSTNFMEQCWPSCCSELDNSILKYPIFYTWSSSQLQISPCTWVPDCSFQE